MRRFLISLPMILSVSLPCWAGASRSFDGVDDKITVSSVANMTSNWTVSAWIRPTNIDRGGLNEQFAIWSRWTSSSSQRELYVYITSSPDDTIQIDIPFIKAVLTSASTLSNNNWYHIAVTRSTNTWTLYINGTSDATISDSTAQENGGDSTIGLSPPAIDGDDFEGQIAYVQVFTRALTIGEVNQIMHHPGSLVDNLVGYWPILGSESPESDWSGNGHTGTVTQTTTSAIGPPIFLTSPLAWRHWFDRVLDWFVPSVFADDIILCDPADPTVPGRVTSYQKSTDPFKSGAVSNPNSLIWSLPPSTVNPWDGIVPTAPQSYWKCSGNTVVEMSQAEKDAVDAPALAEQARQQAFTDEVVGNDLCTATLTELTDRINTFRDSVNADIAAAANVAQVKTALTTMNTTYAAAFRKVARCIRARAR